MAPDSTSLPSRRPDPSLSLYQLMDPAVLADPYPLYQKLRETDPVHWDPGCIHGDVDGFKPTGASALR